MNENSTVKALLSAVGLVLLLTVLFPLILAIAAYVGYFYGIILSWLAGGILTESLGLSSGDIPAIIAWLSMITLVAIVINHVGTSKKEAD